MSPTEEQVRAVDCFRTNGSLKINAFAGTGKTTTLVFIAASTPRRGTYLAFNRAIAKDAEGKFPRTVTSSTIHSLAYRATPSGFRRGEKMTKAINANALAEALQLKDWHLDRDHKLTPRSQGFLILQTLRRFMQSAAEVLESAHVPRHGRLVTAPESIVAAVRQVTLERALHVWQRMQDANDDLPLGHDGYLKLWALSRPAIACDFILLDEAQDTNPVVLNVLRIQNAQIVYVGDRYQQIYEWRGAVNAMQEISTDHTTHLTTSFRFGEVIADAASRVLAQLGETKRISGNPGIESHFGGARPDAILARTNASVVTAVIEALDAGHRPHLVGGVEEIMHMLRGVQDLKRSEPSIVSDFFGFANWAEVVEFARSGEGQHLLTFVNLVETRGENQLMWALNRTVPETHADFIVSTAHKAKGREWKTVRLMDDFLKSKPTQPGRANGLDESELRLFYVALTRAREVIEVSPDLVSFFGQPSSTQPRPQPPSPRPPQASPMRVIPRPPAPPPLPSHSPGPPPLPQSQSGENRRRWWQWWSS